MNTDNFAVTEYSIPMNAMLSNGRDMVMGNAEGIWISGGAFDEGDAIIPVVEKSGMDFGLSMSKSLPEAYLRISTNGDYRMHLRSENSRGYADVIDGCWWKHGSKIDLPRGIRGREFAFTLTNDGSDIEIDEIEFVAEISQTRRGRQTRG